MKLIDVYDDTITHAILLWQLLSERTPDQSINHREMPTPVKHTSFIRSHPYRRWYVIDMNGELVGACYITNSNEIGIGILTAYKRSGLGKQALAMLLAKHPGDYTANINPANEPSMALFRSAGFTHRQNTYAI